ncbi:hypothetical protein ACWGNJ_29920, partial [Streptomyces niveus]
MPTGAEAAPDRPAEAGRGAGATNPTGTAPDAPTDTGLVPRPSAEGRVSATGAGTPGNPDLQHDTRANRTVRRAGAGTRAGADRTAEAGAGSTNPTSTAPDAPTDTGLVPRPSAEGRVGATGTGTPGNPDLQHDTRANRTVRRAGAGTRAGADRN